MKNEATKKIRELRDALAWCGGSMDFQVNGKAREGWEKICKSLLDELSDEVLALLKEPVCKTCGGSGVVLISENNTPCPSCHPAEPDGEEFVKKLREQATACLGNWYNINPKDVIKACDLLDEKDREYEILEGVIKRQRKGGMELTNLYKALQSEYEKLKKFLLDLRASLFKPHADCCCDCDNCRMIDKIDKILKKEAEK